MTLWEAAGHLASVLVVMAFSMKDIVSLRIIAIASNLAFLTYGIGLSLPPSGYCMRCCCRSMPGGFGKPWRGKQHRSECPEALSKRRHPSRKLLDLRAFVSATRHIGRL